MRTFTLMLLALLPAVAVAQHPVGSEFQVNSCTTGGQYNPAVGPDGAGGFVVAWLSFGSSGTDPDHSIQGQRYTAAGTPAGGEFQVNSYTTSFQYAPAVSQAGDGHFVVAWMSFGGGGTDTSDFSIQAQRYVSDGTPAGGEFQVNTYTTDRQYLPAVSSDGGGGFVVAWQSDGSSGGDSLGYSIQGQLYLADGSPNGDQFQVNTGTGNDQYAPAVSSYGDDGFVVVWTSYSSGGDDSDGKSIQGQRYLSAIFADGFESGDTSAWSTIVP